MTLRPIYDFDVKSYVTTFTEIEYPILLDIHSKNVELREKAYNFYVFDYLKLNRVFKKGHWSMIFTTLTNYYSEKGKSIGELKERFFRNEILNERTKKLNIATTNLFWLFDKETIIINEKTKRVLRASDYDDYVKKWQKEYDNQENEIKRLTEEFGVYDVKNEKWFKMKVFNKYLENIYDSGHYSGRKSNKLPLFENKKLFYSK